VDVRAKPDYTDPANRQTPAIGRMKFVVPPAKLKDGVNCFRIVTFQGIANSEEEINQSIAKFDTDQDGVLSLDEFRRAGLGGILMFNAKDINSDGKLDVNELNLPATPPKQVVYPYPGIDSPPLQNYQTTRSNQTQTQQGLADANQRLSTVVEINGEIHAAQTKLNQLYTEKAQLPDAPTIDQHRPAIELTADVSKEARRLAPELAALEPEDAKIRIDAEAIRITNDVYPNRLGVLPTGAQLDHVTNVLEKHRMGNSIRSGFDNSLRSGQEMLDAIGQVKAGTAPAEGIKVGLPVYDFEDGLVTGREVFRQPITVTAETAAGLELQLTTTNTPTNSADELKTRVFRNLFKEQAAQLGPGHDADPDKGIEARPNSVADTEVPTRGGNTIGSAEYDLLADAMVVQNQGTPNQITLDQAYQNIEGPTHDEKVRKAEFDIAANAKKITEVETDLKGLNQELLDARYKSTKIQAPSEDFSNEIRKIGPRSPGVSRFYEKGINGPVQVLGATLTAGSELANFYHNVTLLTSDPSDCYQIIHAGGTLPSEQFPPGIEPSPNGFEMTAVYREQKDPNNPKGGFIAREFPGEDENSLLLEAGFPPGFLSTDDVGRLYAINLNSTETFGGRIFRYTPVPAPAGPPDTPQPLAFQRDMVGAINYYSLDLQYARPALPVAMTVGPKYPATDKFGLFTTTRDLFVADIDTAGNTKRIIVIPISRLETTHGFDNGQNINRNAGEAIVTSDNFKFTGPSDMEVAYDLASATPIRSSESAMMLSDEDIIWAIFRPSPNAAYIAVKIMQIPGRRFSGLAFDKSGKFYFADYLNKEIFVMDWARLNIVINSSAGNGSPVIQSDNDLYERAFLMARTDDGPGDIEVEGTSSHPNGVLFYSRLAGDVVPIVMPLLGKVGPNIRAIKVKRFSKEDDVAIEPTPAAERVYRVIPTHENLNELKVTLSIKRADAQGNETWQEQTVFLANNGASFVDLQ
jgi:hypothetical protein